MTTIGFIGIGTMGRPMAARLAAAGHKLVVCDVDTKRARAFAEESGGGQAANGREVAAASDVIITMMPTSAHVADVLRGPDGVLVGLRPGTIVIEMSSGAPARTQELAREVAGAGGALIDAPVSGGVRRAVSGQLAIMAGGSEEAIAKVDPILRVLGSTVTRTGDVGSAHAMKALNNLASAAGFLIGVEVMLVGKQFGLDPATVVDILNASTGSNNSTQNKFKQFVLSGSYDAGFGLDLMVKDLTIALELANETGTPAPFSALCQQTWLKAAETLGPGRDHTELARYVQQTAQVELP